MLSILYFARLREDLGLAQESLPASFVDVHSLKTHLMARGGLWACLADPSIRVAVNQVLADDHSKLKTGDEVAFFPPVTGG